MGIIMLLIVFLFSELIQTVVESKYDIAGHLFLLHWLALSSVVLCGTLKSSYYPNIICILDFSFLCCVAFS